MGDGYAILMWDGFGEGLVRINPRLLTKGTDSKGNPRNWWPCDYETPEWEIAAKHKADIGHAMFQVIR